MPLPVTVYRWDDPGAPQITSTGKPSEIINVLKKCLVEGYGNKTPLGWSMPFEDVSTFKAVFQNSTETGSGGAFQIESTDGTDGDHYSVMVTPAASITAVDNFVRRGFKQNLRAEDYCENWIVIGTSTAFYFFIHRADVASYDLSTRYEASLFAGDFVSVFANDVSRFIAIVQPGRTGDSSSTNWGNTIGNMGSQNVVAKVYETTGGDASDMLQTQFDGPKLVADPDENMPLIVLENIRLRCQSSYNNLDSSGTRLVNSHLMPYLRGVLPGLFLSIQQGYKDVLFPYIKQINGEEHFLVRSRYSNNAWINMEQWDV
ncbi:hypothetical protein [Shewanella algae]|uniref:hypothetical protein n=1 Tax=Shewanella algae TaxID=38313 RepID=UPI0031F47CC6